MKTVAVICARGGSKGLRNKNLQLLSGVPLIGRVILHALQAECIDTIICSTDDDEIAKTAEKFGAAVPFRRPTELSGDLATTEETLRHALVTFEQQSGTSVDTCVFLTATDIFRNPGWIDMAVEKLESDPELESVFVGSKTHKNFWELGDDGQWTRLRPWMAHYSSRQVRRFVVREDTGLACASRAWLWREGRRIGDRVDVIINDDDFAAIDIHTIEDLLLAQAALDIRDAK